SALQRLAELSQDIARLILQLLGRDEIGAHGGRGELRAHPVVEDFGLVLPKEVRKLAGAVRGHREILLAVPEGDSNVRTWICGEPSIRATRGTSREEEGLSRGEKLPP